MDSGDHRHTSHYYLKMQQQSQLIQTQQVISNNCAQQIPAWSTQYSVISTNKSRTLDFGQYPQKRTRREYEGGEEDDTSMEDDDSDAAHPQPKRMRNETPRSIHAGITDGNESTEPFPPRLFNSMPPPTIIIPRASHNRYSHSVSPDPIRSPGPSHSSNFAQTKSYIVHGMHNRYEIY